MKHIFFAIAFSAAALLPASSVRAADLDSPPPPVEDLRPATYDWSGPYAGAFAAGVTQTGSYVANCAPCTTGYGEMNGHGWNGGALVGWNYQMDSFVLGLEGDWAFGGRVAKNDEASQLNKLNFDNIATLRARAGLAMDDTLFYATGGVAFVDSTFATSALGGASAEDSKWLTGWIIGGGIEHAFTDSISARLEYTYMGLPDTTYSLVNGGGAVDVDHTFDGVHTVSVGLDYNFGW